MAKTFKTGDIITIYFGDSIRKLLRKALRKKHTYFVDYIVIAKDSEMLTVLPNSKVKDVDEPYEITALRINRSDRHILTRGELENLRTCGKSEFYQFAEERGYNSKEFKEAFKPFRKAAKKED